MSFGIPVVPPESWKMQGSVGSILMALSASGPSVGFFSISSESEYCPLPGSPRMSGNYMCGFTERTRSSIGRKSKSPWRSGAMQVVAPESCVNWLTSA